jgi:hypothetical protein
MLLDRRKERYHRPAMKLRAAAVALALLESAPALAQEEPVTGSIALDQFDPTPAGDVFFTVPAPYAIGDVVEPRAKVVVEGASQPLRLVLDGQEAAVVSSQMMLHLDASIAFVDRLMLDLLLPVALVQSGDSPTLGSVRAASPESAQLGDLRIGLRVRLYGEHDEPFQIGTGAYLWVPTGPAGSYVGEDAFREAVYLSLGGRFHLGIDWWWTLFGGPHIRQSENGSTVRYGGGVAALFFDDLLQFGTEVVASTPFQDTSGFQLTAAERVETPETSNVELLLGLRVRLWHFVTGVAGGPGLTRALGTPAFRLAGSFGYEPMPSEPDRGTLDSDEDGVVDRDDSCPYAHGEAAAGTERHGCPEHDDDEDGVMDRDDACPGVYGAESDDADQNGCPPSVRE